MQRKINFPGFYFLPEEIFFERLIYFERLYITPIYKEKYNRRFYQTDTIYLCGSFHYFLIRLILFILYSMKKPLSRVWGITVFLFLFYRTFNLREERPYNRNYDNGYNHGNDNQTGSAFYVIHERVFPGSQDEGVRRCAYRAGKCAGGSNENRHKYGSR